MYQDTYYVPKSSGTYADVLTAYGLAILLDRLFGTARDPAARWRIQIEDAGSCYRIRLGEPVQEAWIEQGLVFRSPAPFITGQNVPGEVPPDTDTRDVDKTWEQVRAYGSTRASLRDDGLQGTELEQQLRDMEPPADWTVVAFLGDGRMQALSAYNRIVATWAQSRAQVPLHVKTILRRFSRPEGDDTALEEWRRAAKGAVRKTEETACQLLNPHQGKGLNEPKANLLRMDNIKDRPWPEEFLKTVGLWACVAPRRVEGENDWKVYVLAPFRISLRAHREVFERFSRYLWNERGSTSLKTDITSLLLFLQAWLDYVEAAGKDEADFDADISQAIPEKTVAGFHVAQFKLLSRNAYTMVNLSFLQLPRWTGEPQTRAEILSLREVIQEHLRVIRVIDETRSDGFNLLRTYREFVAGNHWDAFFDFAAGYGHEMIRQLQAGKRRSMPMLTTTNLGRLMMASNKPLLNIVQNEGFQNVAYAIRHSTVIPQGRKARGEDYLYDVRYGLGAELKRKATVRDEFIVALMDFVHNYNQENAQVLERTGQQMRRDLRTTDVEEVVRLVDEYGSEAVANLLVAYGYAREPREPGSGSAESSPS